MDKTYSGTSYRAEVREVVFGREGGAGWKLDVIGHDPEWSDPYGDAWEQTLDAILPYLARFVDGGSVWKERSTDNTISFWDVVAAEVVPAGE